MKALLLAGAGVAAALSLAVAATAATPSGSASAAPRVGVASSTLGRILVDARGRTLYMFGRDRHGTSACSGKCAAFWPPLIATGRPAAAAGARASLLGTTRRADGRLQVTYNGHPLYTFVKDLRKGQTNGEELDVFGGTWYAVSPGGGKVARASTATGSGGSGYGYGY